MLLHLAPEGNGGAAFTPPMFLPAAQAVSHPAVTYGWSGPVPVRPVRYG
jgi:hypothetical protein